MKPTIHLVFVDDWELSGNGSGDVRELQFEPMRQLIGLYKQFGIRGSFNAEVMQQLSFRKNQGTNPELRVVADEWDEHVRDAYSQGHDVQLHIHPQWRNGEYDNGKWRLTSDWSILNYSKHEAAQMLSEGREYLEKLLRPVDPEYRCVSFRSGAWCIAPSPQVQDRAIVEHDSPQGVDADDLLLRLNLISIHAASTTDLRFLDALNYYYELLPSKWSPESRHPWMWASYLALYSRALMCRS
jgi:hypothetical protein